MFLVTVSASKAKRYCLGCNSLSLLKKEINRSYRRLIKTKLKNITPEDWEEDKVNFLPNNLLTSWGVI